MFEREIKYEREINNIDYYLSDLRDYRKRVKKMTKGFLRSLMLVKNKKLKQINLNMYETIKICVSLEQDQILNSEIKNYLTERIHEIVETLGRFILVSEISKNTLEKRRDMIQIQNSEIDLLKHFKNLSRGIIKNLIKFRKTKAEKEREKIEKLIRIMTKIHIDFKEIISYCKGIISHYKKELKLEVEGIRRIGIRAAT